MIDPVPEGWAGIDVGKGHHWICLIDVGGKTLWSSKVTNDEADILEAIGQVRCRADQVTWAVDVTGTMSGLLLALLAVEDQVIKYVPGRVVNTMTTAYRLIGDVDSGRVLVLDARSANDIRNVQELARFVLSAAPPNPERSPAAAWASASAGAGDSAPVGPRSERPGVNVLSGFGIGRTRRMHLVVRAGRAGLRGRGGHDHADMTSPVLSIDGLPVLVDPGTNRYSYSISERLAELSARGHNMVIVDQVDPLPVMDGSVMPMVSARTVGKVEARRRRHALALRTTHDGFAAVPGVHAYSRDFVLDLKSDSLSIRDVLEGMGRHRVESAWHFHPDVLVLREGHRLDLVDRASSQPFAQMTLDDAWETLQLSEYAYSEQYGERVTATRLQLASMMEFPTEVVTKFDSAIESGTL